MRAGSENSSASCAARKAPCSGDDFEAAGVGPDGDGLNEAMLPDALGKLFQLALLEGLARVGGGLVYGGRWRWNWNALLSCMVPSLWAVDGCGCGAHTLPCIRSVGGETWG